MSKPLVIFGVGDLPEQAYYYFSQHAGRQVEAFTVDAEFLTTDHFAGLPVLPFEETQRRFPPATHELFVAIGYSRANSVRRRVFLDAQARGYTLPSFVHETAVVARNVHIGANCLLRELAALSPFATLGDNVFVGVHANVSHHARIASHVFIAGGAIVCGRAILGEGCFIGASSVVRDQASVGPGCIVGAGAVILGDCDAGGVYVATPTPRRERS
ncbi:MAG TPA: NeuD/PglB/VioB family sugar acetyltransferase [Rubrivivax sp.]|nr:NeuD/PglB/VioB family sugar acetyltransferase [Rubrivivax sp.]